jgi:hypothetical protein
MIELVDSDAASSEATPARKLVSSPIRRDYRSSLSAQFRPPRHGTHHRRPLVAAGTIATAARKVVVSFGPTSLRESPTRLPQPSPLASLPSHTSDLVPPPHPLYESRDLPGGPFVTVRRAIAGHSERLPVRAISVSRCLGSSGRDEVQDGAVWEAVWRAWMEVGPRIYDAVDVDIGKIFLARLSSFVLAVSWPVDGVETATQAGWGVDGVNVECAPF